MAVFRKMYERAILWAAHPKATWYLGFLSFIEAIFFPIMPEVMMAPMCLAKPQHAYRYATISLICGLVGSLLGYALGHFAFEALKPLFAALGMLPAIESGIATLQAKMVESPWAVFTFLVLGGFMPIPMKVFTWASGIVGVPLPQYFLSMLVGRGKRVYLLAAVIRFGGAQAAERLRRWIEPLGWIATALVVGLVAWLVWRAKFA